jgi:hypothetical protein
MDHLVQSVPNLSSPDPANCDFSRPETPKAAEYNLEGNKARKSQTQRFPRSPALLRAYLRNRLSRRRQLFRQRVVSTPKPIDKSSGDHVCPLRVGVRVIIWEELGIHIIIAQILISNCDPLFLPVSTYLLSFSRVTYTPMVHKHTISLARSNFGIPHKAWWIADLRFCSIPCVTVWCLAGQNRDSPRR